MQVIKNRRSVRTFTGQKVPREDILSIVEAGTWAPTGCNNQELRFLVIDDEERLKQLIRFKPFFKGVSTAVLVFCDMSLPMSVKMYVKLQYERQLRYVDTGLALANMVLCAKSLGVDSCIFNLSPYHMRKAEAKTGLQRLLDKAKRKLGLRTRLENNFEYFLRNYLRIPMHLEIMCGVAFGYARKYPDLETERHGGRLVMRAPVDHYLVQSPSCLAE